ncbi:hypothetical protein CBM2600_A10135 [Cupriavidus taiwanensis]|nr:hypothetical protein CBM2600_A10135 [Cupriavidus taiwanensis]
MSANEMTTLNGLHGVFKHWIAY